MNQSRVPLPSPIDPVDQRPTHVRWKVMAFLCVLSFLTYFDRFCIVQAQGAIQKDLALSDAQIGWIMGAFWLAYALFEIPSGWLGDRYGTRGTLIRIVLAWSLFTALSGSAVGFFSLLAYRFLFGVGEAGAFPNMARVQAAWLPTHARARWGGLLWLMARWGAAASPRRSRRSGRASA
jgi:MFS family permease